jgi:HD-GYP domain-containing protein (c-di-GMP phosphodiesterase class II)
LENVRKILSITPDLYSHSKNVTNLAVEFANYTGFFNSSEIDTIRIGSMLHDIGKCFIPRDILLKEGKLTYEEFEVVKRHAEYGYNYLGNGKSDSEYHLLIPKDELCLINSIYEQIKDRKLELSYEAKLIVIQHHERLDGSGYPFGLQAQDIHPFAKLVALCDVFEAITSPRCYKPTYDPFYAMEFIHQGLGTKFDDELGILFLEFVKKVIKTPLIDKHFHIA